MKKYVSPEIHIEDFSTSDVITVSLIFRAPTTDEATEEMTADYQNTFWG